MQQADWDRYATDRSDACSQLTPLPVPLCPIHSYSILFLNLIVQTTHWQRFPSEHNPRFTLFLGTQFFTIYGLRRQLYLKMDDINFQITILLCALFETNSKTHFNLCMSAMWPRAKYRTFQHGSKNECINDNLLFVAIRYSMNFSCL